MIVGFTGTQGGMTAEQEATVEALLKKHDVTKGRHGDCIGSDATFHSICQRLEIDVVLHPPTKKDKRAFCKGSIRECPPLGYIKRNHAIVDGSRMVIGTPKGYTEELRSGTWATLRYARKKNREVYVVWPDGSVIHGDWTVPNNQADGHFS